MKTKGLTLVEAIQSGKRFKRAGESVWFDAAASNPMKDGAFVMVDYAYILATDYELESVKVTIDREMLAKAWDSEQLRKHLNVGRASVSCAFSALAKELGL